jgi:hypothetical protein
VSSTHSHQCFSTCYQVLHLALHILFSLVLPTAEKKKVCNNNNYTTIVKRLNTKCHSCNVASALLSCCIVLGNVHMPPCGSSHAVKLCNGAEKCLWCTCDSSLYNFHLPVTSSFSLSLSLSLSLSHSDPNSSSLRFRNKFHTGIKDVKLKFWYFNFTVST